MLLSLILIRETNSGALSVIKRKDLLLKMAASGSLGREIQLNFQVKRLPSERLARFFQLSICILFIVLFIYL